MRVRRRAEQHVSLIKGRGGAEIDFREKKADSLPLSSSAALSLSRSTPPLSRCRRWKQQQTIFEGVKRERGKSKSEGRV